MYKAARDVHTNGIHNTFTSKGRGKMNHIKQFFREKGLYLFCLAMVFAATAAGILALRTVVSNVADLTRTRKEALQNDSAWTQPDTIHHPHNTACLPGIFFRVSYHHDCSSIFI